MLPSEVLKQIRSVELRAGHLVTDALAGNYLSAFKGRGMEFDEVREYSPGDDVRTLDWNVTARMGAPYVKILKEERELTLMLLVDVSPSLDFGSFARKKREVAAELAAVLAFLATRNQDKVGLLSFSDHVEAFTPPKKGRSHIWSIIRSVLTQKGRGKTTDLNAATQALLRYQSRRCTCFVISDFFAPDVGRVLAKAAKRHEVIAVQIEDPKEAVPPDVGVVAFRDLETGAYMEVDTSAKAWRRAFASGWAEREEQLRVELRRAGIGFFKVKTDSPTTGPLVSFLQARERRGQR